ncbi:MAG: hypothetical protein KatS3mg081_0309 [Gemmatimonadales bacterium]|nr:MAG: hypothetical protein KatS3mg081_0309 [Gemmatimonadales bacterium]
MSRPQVFPALAAALLTAAACGTGEPRSWRGSIDTLPSGTIVVSNPADGIWDEQSAWRIVEELRIGTAEGSGPELFGSIGALEVDRLGRIWVLEQQAQEIRVFDGQGRYVRTVGRKGGGPGEFRQVIGFAWGADGNLWVVDPSNNRISVVDTAGRFVTSHRTIGSWVIAPWPGGVDSTGNFYTYAPAGGSDPLALVLVRYNAAMEPQDTIRLPRESSDESYFEHRTDGGFIRAGVPYASRLQWRFRWPGYIWFGRTGEYRLYQRSLEGDTLRIVSREFEPLPVTDEDIDSAIARLEWFTKQGGRIDRSKFPRTKPAWEDLYTDDRGYLWVVPVLPKARSGFGITAFDIFDPEGRYLGRVELPFNLGPGPVIRGDFLYGEVWDELQVPYVVRARIERPL